VTIEIRLATANDVDALAGVHVQAHQETYPPLVAPRPYHGPDLATRRAMWAEILTGGGHAVFVACDDGQVVGFAQGHGTRIGALYILAAYHRRGIWRALLRRLVRELAARGAADISFEVMASNRIARAFYESEGGRLVGTRTVEELGERFEDAIYAIAGGVTAAPSRR
jgi:ribosomal protein S18 acetylase RimI-like enzyme